jgi:hypothetical protein
MLDANRPQLAFPTIFAAHGRMMFARLHQSRINPLPMHYDVKSFKPRAMEGIGFRGLAPYLVNCVAGRKTRAMGQACVAVVRDGVIRFVKPKGRWIPGRESRRSLAGPGWSRVRRRAPVDGAMPKLKSAMLTCAGRFPGLVAVRVGER